MQSHYGIEFPEAADSTEGVKLALHSGLPPTWSNCGATADFLGNLYARAAARAGKNAKETRHGINYLANEILENAVKFRHPASGAIQIEARFQQGRFELQVRNYAEPAVAANFQTLLQELTSRDPGELMIERIEANAMDDTQGGSGLGILTMMNDYGAELGWRFTQTQDGEPVQVDTYLTVQLVQ
jgi:hypothetical protein